ncbi:DUF2304 domain-containing protein [Paucibacter sp. B2R-40]|uniref:DUF2304 domain-containing protein n=1 Tax=Paucibacter sp. B2R-40 TaxID=2893554 RepID=UPI0021E35D5F|nr:DUF2304 domain-containing protein [Paucibacter sp. B2R-40]MCV2353662.1 DUF2304 domain-containing protein [Paucibacter sp. B2R-40]
MIMQFILISGLLACLIYAFLQRQKSRLISALLAVISILGIVFVSTPELTNVLAKFVGIGRGADLILYCWLLISIVVSVNLQMKILSIHKNITDLTRELALMRPQSQLREIDRPDKESYERAQSPSANYEKPVPFSD